MPTNTPDLSKIKENSPTISTDEMAKEEARSFIAESKRKRMQADSIHWANIIFTWVVMLAIVGVIFIRLLNMVLEHPWLSDKQDENLKEFFMDGMIGGIVINYFKSKIVDKR